MVLMIPEIKYYDNGIEGEKHFILEYSTDAIKDLPKKEFKKVVENRNKEHFKAVVESFKEKEDIILAKKEDQRTWFRMGAGILHLLEYNGEEYIAVPRYDAFHPSNPTKLSLCSGVTESAEEIINPFLRAEQEGFEELFFVVKKGREKTLLLPQSQMGKKAVLEAAKKINLEARCIEIPFHSTPHPKDTIIINHEGKDRLYLDAFLTYNFTNNSFNVIQVKKLKGEDIQSVLGGIDLNMLTLYTFEETQAGKRIKRHAHLFKVKDILSNPNHLVPAWNYDGNGSACNGATFYDPTLSLRTVIAKLYRNENWHDLLKVE